MTATLTHLEAVHTYDLEETATGYDSYRDMVKQQWTGRESWRHGDWMRTEDALAAAERDVESATAELREALRVEASARQTAEDRAYKLDLEAVALSIRIEQLCERIDSMSGLLLAHGIADLR